MELLARCRTVRFFRTLPLCVLWLVRYSSVCLSVCHFSFLWTDSKILNWFLYGDLPDAKYSNIKILLNIHLKHATNRVTKTGKLWYFRYSLDGRSERHLRIQKWNTPASWPVTFHEILEPAVSWGHAYERRYFKKSIYYSLNYPEFNFNEFAAVNSLIKTTWELEKHLSFF